LKSSAHFGLLIFFFERRYPSLQFDRGGEIGMNNKVLGCLVAGALAAILALGSPALARGGGGGGGGGGHGGGGMPAGGMPGGGMHAGGGHFASGHYGHAGFSPRFGFRGHRFGRFAFVGVPFGYAAYSSCWRRAWTPYGPRWINVCSDYGYY
jgi:hypothetical protein